MHSLGGGPISRRGGAREHFLSASFKHHQEHRSHIELFYSWQKSYIEKHLPWIEKVSAFAFQKRRLWKRNKKRSWTYWHMVSLINFVIDYPEISATPLRSNISRCGSVEVISDVELTSSESVQSSKVSLKRRRDTITQRRQKTLSTIVFRSALIPFDEFDNMDQVREILSHVYQTKALLPWIIYLTPLASV